MTDPNALSQTGTAPSPEASLPAESRADRFLSQLAERLGATVHARLVFADPVERDGVTVIPVARVRWGLGGGGGTGGPAAGRETARGERGGGLGGGGGVVASPAGYIEIVHGRTRYRPIVDPVAMMPMAALTAVALAFLLSRLLGRRRSD